MIPKHYLKEPVIKMGRWALWPADSENWHGQETSNYFKKVFGIGKGTLTLHLVDEHLPQNAYFPKKYFAKLYERITQINKKDYKNLEKKLSIFYNLKHDFKKAVPKISVKNYKKLSNRQLANLYLQNRDWVHQATVYDQFGWIAEEYWPPIMTKILIAHGIVENSEEYHRILFALTKPEEISTTLEEKREVLKAAIFLKGKKSLLEKAANKLAKNYGWMPVFTFGTPWDKDHYVAELKGLAGKPATYLKAELVKLANYTKIRNEEFESIISKYQLKPKEVQIFVDFGLALDTRNEGEYLVSLAGFHLLPIYKETARRLTISLTQLRCLYETEIVSALLGKIDAEKILARKGKYIGWGFDAGLVKRVNFTAQETKKLYDYLEKTVVNLQGNNEHQGVCASPGVVSGRVCIVHGPQDNKKIKSGEILFTHATTVDYLPAMKKAVAFVTEVGGLTCHAAVVAREFGVPCVVGLKNATINFKDGDLIEVDANKGMVRKIK